jgi:hypothetical protein
MQGGKGHRPEAGLQDKKAELFKNPAFFSALNCIKFDPGRFGFG